MYIRYICKKKSQVLLSFIYFSPILRQMCLWKRGDIIHERCRNSHFRALIIHNFLRPPTTVLNIFLYHISPHASSPSPPSRTPANFSNGDAVPEERASLISKEGTVEKNLHICFNISATRAKWIPSILKAMLKFVLQQMTLIKV